MLSIKQIIMQKKLLFKLLLLGALPLIIASCGKNNIQGRLVPIGASFVVTMDGKSLSSKLSWEEIKQNPLFAELKADSTVPAAVKSLLDNPENSGVDLKADCLLFALKDSIGTYIGFQGNIKDENKFAAFNKQITENGVESESDKIKFISKYPVCVGWSREKFTYIIDASQVSEVYPPMSGMLRDSNNISHVARRDIGATCKSVFALKEGNSLAKDERFTQLMKETGDMHFWINSEALMSYGTNPGPLSIMNLEKFYKGSATTGTINFANGQILVKAKSYASGELIDVLKKYAGAKINEEMIRRMPGKDIVAVMAVNFKPEGIRELIKLTGLDGLANSGLQNLGFTMDDIIKANKGDFLVGVSDLSLQKGINSYNAEGQREDLLLADKPDFKFIFSLSIADKEAFNKILNAGKKLSPEMGDGSNSPIAYKSDGNWFVISNNIKNVDQFLGKPEGNFDFISKISGKPVGGYVNLQALINVFGQEASKDSAAKIVYDASKKMWSDMLWKGGDYADGGIEQTLEINLVDKTTNSLKQLNQYVTKLSELYNEKRRRQKEAAMAIQDFDTSTVPVPAPAE